MLLFVNITLKQMLSSVGKYKQTNQKLNKRIFHKFKHIARVLERKLQHDSLLPVSKFISLMFKTQRK